MKKTSFVLLLGIAVIALQSRADDKWNISKLNPGKLPPAVGKSSVTFDKDIKPLFEASCVKCHGDDEQKGNLRLDSLEATLKGGKAGKVVAAGDSAKSLLMLAVSQQDDATAMPPKRRPRGGPGGPGNQPSGPANAPGGAPRGPGGPDGQGVPGGGSFGGPPGPGGRGPQAKPFTSEQIALVRAWIDQGAK